MLRGNCSLDIVEELRVRQWARRHWVPASLRDRRWHPVILEEMLQRDQELGDSDAMIDRIVPLGTGPTLPRPHFLDSPAARDHTQGFYEYEADAMHFG